MGVNALDAVQLTFAGINALRQHVKSDVRIHGIVSNGGEAPNIVPEKAACKFFVRAAERSYLDEVTKKVINCAKGAELMTGAKLSYRYFENSFDNIINNKVLQKITKNNLIEAGITDILEGKDGPVGSTDIGNVSQVCPTMYTEIALDINPMVYVHEKEFLSYANSEEAYDKLHKAVKAMVGCALEIYLEDGLLDEIKKNHLN
ncbi:amidohydrolase, M20D family [Clostridioides difficile]|nr:amidohydrolase, M20D family [Clostridioides difficile]